MRCLGEVRGAFGSKGPEERTPCSKLERMAGALRERPLTGSQNGMVA